MDSVQKERALQQANTSGSEFGRFLGRAIGSLIVVSVVSAFAYFVLAIFFSLSVTFGQVFGTTLLIQIVSRFVKYSIQD